MKKTFLALALGFAFAGAAQAADIIPINTDPAGQGLNDPTPLAPAGGNPGTTVGEQRRIVYQFAADLWGGVLESDVPIRVQARFLPLRCDSTGTVLGSAGAGTGYILTEEGKPPTIYPAALTDALVGYDVQNGAGYDIVSQFNSSYGGTNPDGTPCSPGSGWYYGLDGNTPAGKTNFLNVVMHEIAHGLGFAGWGNLTTGALNSGYQDIYSRFVYDNVSQKGWYELDNAGRVAAAKAGGLVFRGPNVTAQVPLVLSEQVALRASGTITGNYAYGVSLWAAVDSGFAGEVVAVDDGSAAPTHGCAASPAGAYAGKIALVDRGTCAFEIKTRFAQDAGAVGVIIANNTTGVLNMSDDATVAATIPAVMVSQADGAAIRAGVPGVSVAIAPVPGVLAGADAAGYARLYAPSTLATGSTFSHYDTSATPNALMEPFISGDLRSQLDVDLTTALFQDQGWTLNPGTAKIPGAGGAECDTTIGMVATGGLIAGASLEAMQKICAATTTGDAYQRCVTGHADQLEAAGLLGHRQGRKVTECTKAYIGKKVK